jgi:uncharacterized protein (TIGR02147 family)
LSFGLPDASVDEGEIIGGQLDQHTSTQDFSARATGATASSKSAVAPDVSQYVDYREYLRDYFEFKKKTESTVLRPYTYSVFSASADIRSPNYLKLVIEGQRNLSESMALKFAKAIKLNRLQTEEFCLLVAYGQETEPQKRSQHLRKLSEFRYKNQIRMGEISSKTTQLLPNWLTWVLYHMADQEGVEFSPEKMRQLIRTQTHIEEIRRSLERLIEAGLLTRNADDGKICKGKELVDDPQDVPPALIKKLQTELIYLGMESLFVDSPTDREFGAMTVSLTAEEFNRFKFELRQFRKKWAKDIATNRSASKGEGVYQFNPQIFPITDKN